MFILDSRYVAVRGGACVRAGFACWALVPGLLGVLLAVCWGGWAGLLGFWVWMASCSARRELLQVALLSALLLGILVLWGVSLFCLLLRSV